MAAGIISATLRKGLLGAVAATALAGAAGVVPVIAAETTATRSETIIVTARKREENLQDVPLAIAAYTNEDLERLGATDLRDVVNLTPGVTLAEFGGGFLSAPVVRGLSQANLSAGENNVSVFVDGIYFFDNSVIDISLIDVDRVEITKGPASALYGRNAFAGAINYVTRAPSRTFEGKVIGTLGSDDRGMIRGTVSGPITDKLFGRISAGYDTFGGGYADPVNGAPMNGYEKSAAQLALRFDPGTFGRIDLVYYYGYADNDPAARVVPGGAFQMNCVRGTASPALGLPPPAITAFTDFCGVYPDGDDLPAPQRPRERATFDQTGNATSVHHFNLRGDFDLWGGTLSTAVGYTKSKVEVFRSFDNRRDGLAFFLTPGGVTTTALANTFQGQANQNDETSLEVRWRSDQTKPVRWMVGAFLWRWDSDRPTLFGIDTTNFPAGTSPRLPVAGFRSFLTSDGRPSPFPTGGINVFYTEDRAYFGSLEWDITDQLTASIEVRNSRETKFRDLLLNPNTQTDTDGPGFKGSWDKTDPRFTLQYRWSDTLQFYASAAQGSKSGGFNTAATLASDVPFNPESNWTYELGAKGNLFDGALSFDAAIFSIDWSDVQLQAPPTPPSLTPITRNFGEVEARGAELALAWRATDWARLNLGVGYTDPKFTGRGSVDLAANTITFCLTDPRCSGDIIQITPPGGTPRNALSLDGNQLPRSSQWTVSAGADLERALTPVWTGYARGSYRFESEQFMAPNNFARIGDRHLLALRVGAFSDTFDVALWGENLTDDSTPLITGFATLLNTALTEQQVVLSTPRTWGVTASWKF